MRKALVIVSICLCFAGRANAQWVVSDPGNLAQSIINSAKEMVETAIGYTSRDTRLSHARKRAADTPSPGKRMSGAEYWKRLTR